ncbi:MAG: TFIIH/NER complex subunit [Bathelium mastoideum]|nr:MAG: TFIIH/NER complex subunit [Bathelium mastoideum]KAI9691189.1 MAG: TFIIH/NER complex subunit [Bathelium mastoideum]
MSRIAQRGSASAPNRAGDGEDICPVCKTSRYLNPNMRFLVNPECYHKMCESCVDRIFSQGPAQCPVAGCRRTLRKNRFRKQTFEDIQVEREVDIRRRVADVFNKREEDFDTLLDYNNYLNDVEDLTFNLIYKIDLEQSERKLEAYRLDNEQSILQNKALASQEIQSAETRRLMEQEQAKLRREAARREDEEQRREREEGRQDVINKLAVGDGDAAKIAEESHRIVLKKSSARRAALERQQQIANESNGASTKGVFIKGLKQKVEPEPERPYDPFGGLSDARDYYVLQNDYDVDWLRTFKQDLRHNVGGYDFQEFYDRALCEAFSGLGVFVEDEMAGKELSSVTPGSGLAAANAAVEENTNETKVKVEDIF